MAEDSEEAARSIKDEIDQLCSMMSVELLDALSKAAADDEEWTEAGRDIRAFLGARGIEVLTRAEIRLLRTYPQPTPSCPPGYLRVCRLGPDRRVPICTVELCSEAPHVGKVCIEVTVRSEVVPGVYDCHCVPIDSLVAGPA
jgi:hypothetical protein